MTQTSSEYIKENFVFNYTMFILDSIGFGSAFALLIPLSYTPDVAFEISGAWFAAPSVIIMFYFLNIFGARGARSHPNGGRRRKCDFLT